MFKRTLTCNKELKLAAVFLSSTFTGAGVAHEVC